MEFPDLGKHCALAECKQLDFLPVECDSCAKMFCKDHVGYDQHKCTEAYKKDRRVPVCPLCNQPISINPGEVPDRRVNEHIESDCKSDLALAKRKTYKNRCSVKGCKQRELVPVTCATCRKNFCLRHRHENDHECIDLTSSTSKSLQRSTAAQVAGQKAAARFESYNTSRRQIPQKTTLSAVGQDLNRERQQRSQLNSQPASSQRQNIVRNNQGGMTEDEALAFALQASLADTPKSNAELKQNNQDNSNEDLALARAIEQSEIDERNRQRQATQHRTDKESRCHVT